MPVTPNELLDAAKVLGRGEAEVDRRNAASRAYYAAWHRCLPIGRSVGLSAQPGQGMHQQLIGTLTGNRNPALKSLGYMLRQCRDLRVEADYEIETDFPPEDARTVLTQCEKILNKAAAFLPAPEG